MGDEENKRRDDLTAEFIKQHEGYSPETYEDTKGLETIGYGANLASPDVPKIMDDMNIDHDLAIQGRVRIGKDTANKIFDAQRQEKEQIFDNINKRDFPNSEITENERAALISLGYNSPKLWGPNLRSKLEANDDIGVAREILLQSNKSKTPGLQKRRLEEAKLYSGENWEKVYQTLSPQERKEIRNIILQIKNPHERERVLNEFPFLRPNMRFQKLRKP
jgi:GH24 family phage-related lysozyme (muramidase)